MFGVEAVSSYVLTLGLLTVFALIWVTRQQKTKQDATTWLVSGIVGVLLGAAGAMAGTYALGYQVTEPPPVAATNNSPPAAPTMGGGGAPPAAGGGGMGGMGGGMMGMMGGGQGPRPKQQLTSLVRKLELLTGDIALNLTDEQRQAIAKQLDEFAELQTLTDDEAEKKYKDLLAVFDDGQKAKQDAIGLPRGGFGGGGGGFGGGGTPTPPDANPFESETNANALKSLRERLTAK